MDEEEEKIGSAMRTKEEEEEEKMMRTKEDETPKLIDLVFGWSIQDVMNKDLYKNEVDRIPENFTSVEHYLSSFITPLIEETHADLRSNMMGVHSAPAREISQVTMSSHFREPHNLSYSITLKARQKSGNIYEPEAGDLIALTEVRPKCIDDLNGPKRSYVVALVQGMKDEETNSILIQSSTPIFSENGNELFAVYLTNMTTNMRIWHALHPCEGGFSPIIKSVLRINPCREDDCGLCCGENESSELVKMREVVSSFGLDGSQRDAVMNCLALTECDHRNSVKLIWGPPGTGKTKTIATLAFSLLRMRQRTLICAPTNVAVVGLYTNMPTSLLPLEVVKLMFRVLDFLNLLHKHVINGRGLAEDLFGQNESGMTKKTTGLRDIRSQCLQALEHLHKSFSDVPEYSEDYEIRNFVMKNVCLAFCTVSSSAKLHTDGLFNLVIIDEAAQVKECESLIPLQLPGLKHAVLVGDEKQLPAMVISKICDQASFGRSLFERLVTLGYRKQLLNVQYRMHPSISLFPNKMFYGHLIKNGPNVTASAFEKRFLKERLFGPFSFINVTNGQEEFDNRHSRKNSMEVSIIAEILSKLYKECNKSKQKVRIGCISPYKAQAFAIEEALGKTYSSDANDAFSVNVRSIDGFQGGEEDIIIMSTVRSNGNGSVGFLDNYQRTNVALTRARYCLWILGNGATLLNSGSVWQKLVKDAKERGCYYNAYEDKDLSLAIRNSMVNLGNLNSLLSVDSVLFKLAKWKVNFGPKFRESIARLKDVEVTKEVISVLENLSNGFHDHQKDETAYLEGASSQLVKCSVVKGSLRLVWTIDILRENKIDTQAIKVLDVLPRSQILELASEFDLLFGNYTMNQMSRCLDKRIEGGVMVPTTWPVVGNVRSAFSCSEVDANLASQLDAVSLRDEAESRAKRSFVGKNYGGRRRSESTCRW